MAAPTALQLEAEIAGEERAIRHLIGERRAITSQIARDQAREKLLADQLHRITTRNHPVVRPPAPGFPHGDRFYDVSSFQPHVDFAASRAGSVRTGTLAVTKLTEGTSWIDPFGAARLRAMAAAGFPHRGGYHFLHPSERADQQAEHFLTVLHSHGVVPRPTDVCICDVEVSDGEPGRVVAAAAHWWAQVVRQHVPCKLWLYGGGPFLHEYGVTLAGFDAHWLAAYVSNPAPFEAFGRARTIAWQYTDGKFGPVPHGCPGIGPCDMSIIL